jgi:RNA polymerase sigma-70 factor (ECF subfamily)
MSGKERRDTAGRIIEENLDYLVRFAYYRLGSRDDAEDVVYDSVLRFLEKSPDDVRPEGVRLYLYRIVHNLCVDRSRGGKFVVVPVDGLDVEDRAEDVLDLEDADRVNACLDSLPAREADVIRMNVIDNLSFVEISGILSIPQSTAKSRYKSGMEKLRKLLVNDKMS